jgi:Domain of unknown function (DUF4388)
MDFSGHLSAFPAANILQWAAQESRTGALVVRRARCEKRIYFRDGRVTACLSDDPGESFGRYLLLYGYVSEENLVRALQGCRQTGRRLGAMLVEQGSLSERQVRDTLQRQFSDSVCDIFLWKRGIFYFETEEPPAEEIPPEAIDTVGLVMEGTRWIDEVARLRKIFVHDNVILRHGPKYPVGGLTPFESRIGATVDGRSNLADLYSAVRGSHFRFLDAAYKLCLREVLDIAYVGEANEPATSELKLLEPTIERSLERHPALPVTVFGGMYPVLTELPEAAQLSRHSRPVLDFLTNLDGRSKLEELLAADSERAEIQLEALLVELRQGRVALLPASPERLDERADETGEPAAGRWWRHLSVKR